MKSSVNRFVEGEHYLSLGLLTLAKEKFIEALELNQQSENQEGDGVCYIYLAQIAAAEKNKPEALTCLAKARDHYQKRQMEQMLAQITLLENAVNEIQKPVEPVIEPESETAEDPFELFANGKVPEAIEIFKSDVNKFRRDTEPEQLATSLLNLSRCQFNIGDNQSALENLYEAKQIAGQGKNISLIQSIDQTLKLVELVLERVEIDQKSLPELINSGKNPAEKVALALSKAELNIIKGNSRLAEEAIHAARKCVPEQTDSRLQVLIMIVESKLLRLKQKNEAAVQVLQMAQNISHQINDPELLDLILTIQQEFRSGEMSHSYKNDLNDM